MENDALDPRFRGAEIRPEPDFHSGRPQVVDELRPMLGREVADGLKFDDDLVAADEIRRVALAPDGRIAAIYAMRNPDKRTNLG